MSDITPQLKFILDLTKIQALLARRFDGGMGGVGFTEFIILYHLQVSPDNKLRRIDLANKIGLTASGITRMLLPMEKTGLVSKEVNPNDARVSFVLIAPGGKRRFDEARERAELLLKDIIQPGKTDSVTALSAFLQELGGTIY